MKKKNTDNKLKLVRKKTIFGTLALDLAIQSHFQFTNCNSCQLSLCSPCFQFDSTDPSLANALNSKCQCCTWATINTAGQDVSVIPGYSERVVNLSIAALLVLEQQV